MLSSQEILAILQNVLIFWARGPCREQPEIAGISGEVNAIVARQQGVKFFADWGANVSTRV
jgi:hypothetical protein